MENKKLGVWLGQSQASQAMGITLSVFQKRKLNLRNNGLIHQKKKYFIPLSKMTSAKKKQYEGVAVYPEVEDSPEEINELVASVDFTGSKSELDLSQARRRKIIAETEFLSQKIVAKKEQIFSEWSERFFAVFVKSFTKFKNSLIDLHLNDIQLQKLHENLEYAINNMEQCLSEIKSGYLIYDTQDIQNQ